MLIRFFFAVSVIFLIAGCSQVAVSDSSNKGFGGSDRCGISAETSLLIAKGALFLDYDLTDFESEVTESDGVYKIRFIRQSGNIKGSGPTVLVSKCNGERVYTEHSK